MINLLIPLAGKSQYFSENEYPFPKPLIEVGKRTMIEHVLENLATACSKVQFIFVLDITECRKFHLDSTLNIITNNQCKIVYLDNETRGAACSALMAISHINNRQPLIISNSDQLFDDSLQNMVNAFENVDAGIITFESVHPRWSYVRLNEQGLVIETAEKRPISRQAIAGLYYFQHGQDFVDAAMRMILKDSSVNESFFISPTLNELILLGKKVGSMSVRPDSYHTFYTPQKIKEYEALLQRRTS